MVLNSLVDVTFAESVQVMNNKQKSEVKSSIKTNTIFHEKISQAIEKLSIYIWKLPHQNTNEIKAYFNSKF